MVYDCFKFFNELDLLEIRLNVLNDVVDYFILSESRLTFTGNPKPLYFQENCERFKNFSHKIIYCVVEDEEQFIGSQWERELFQTKSLVNNIALNTKNDDIILYSDIDEIPNPDKVSELKCNFDQSKILYFAQRMFYCYFNYEECSGRLLSSSGEFENIKHKKWLGTTMCSRQKILEVGVEKIRTHDERAKGIRVNDGGWHFGYIGAGESLQERVQKKVEAFSHQEFNKQEIIDNVEKNLLLGNDIFGRGTEFKRTKLDKTFPEYLTEHIDKYLDYYLKPLGLKLSLQMYCNRIVKKCDRNIYYFKQKLKQVINKGNNGK